MPREHQISPGDVIPLQNVAKAETELANLKTELEQMHRLSTIGLLAAGIAHEVNNILTPVLAYAHLAKSHPDDRELTEKSISKTITAVETAASIVQSILGFATGADHDDVANIKQTLDAALECMARDPHKDGIKLIIDVTPDLSSRIRPVALQQVFLNLLLNARQALLDQKNVSGGGVIQVAAAKSDEGILITVADNGPGISAEVRDHLFEPFVSSPASESNDQAKKADTNSGSGLGLSVCHRLITEAGGRIEVESQIDKGTTFTIYIAASSKIEA